MWVERGNIVQLKTTDFQYIIFLRLLSYQAGKAVSYIAPYSYRKTGLFKQVVYQGRGGRLAIAPCDGDNLCIRIARGKFYLGDNLYSFGLGLLHYRHFMRNPRAFDNAIGREDLAFGMLAFLPANAQGFQLLLISRFQG